MEERKIYVSVVARFDPFGNITPVTVEWVDGTVYEIDRVLDVRRRASLKAGGSGIRYTVRIAGKTTAIFYEDPAWFVERRDS